MNEPTRSPEDDEPVIELTLTGLALVLACEEIASWWYEERGEGRPTVSGCLKSALEYRKQAQALMGELEELSG